MPLLSLTNFSTQIPADVLQKARKLAVRECDVESGGRYIAYVDEGDSSYDVSITPDKSGAVTAHDCDCNAGPDVFCRHCAALLLHIAEGRKNKALAIPAAPKKAPGKKGPKWAALLEAASEEEMRSWLKTVLLVNKELELAFTHHFTALRQHFTPEEIDKVTQDAIKAVIGKKRRIEQRDLTAIIKLWTGLHQPVLERYKGALADVGCFEGFHAAAESCMALHHGYGRGPGDIPAYIERMLKDTRPLALQLKTAEAWDAATGYFLDKLFDAEHKSWRIPYLLHLRALVQDEASRDRGIALLHRLAKTYGALLPKQAYNSAVANAILFYLLREKGMLAQYLHLITPIRWENEFNLALIREYIALGQKEAAVRICTDQINSNSKEEYNVPYLQLLKQLYTELGDESRKGEVMARLLPLDFDFEAFLYLYEKTPEMERKQLRKTIFAKARRAWKDGKVAAIRFCFALLLAELNGREAIAMIDGKVPYGLLAEYAGEFAAADKPTFIAELLNRHESSAWGVHDDSIELEARENVPVLVSALLRLYTLDELKVALAAFDAKSNIYRMDNYLLPPLRETLDRLEYPPDQPHK